MAKTQQDLTIYRSGSYVPVVNLLDTDGSGWNPNGFDLRYRIAYSSRHAAALLEIDSPDITTDEPVSGTFTATIPLDTARTELLPTGRLYHELYAVSLGGERIVLMTGLLTVIPAQAEHEAVGS